jgi:hypothetical protein
VSRNTDDANGPDNEDATHHDSANDLTITNLVVMAAEIAAIVVQLANDRDPEVLLAAAGVGRRLISITQLCLARRRPRS